MNCEARWDLRNRPCENPSGFRYTPTAHDPPVPAVKMAVLLTWEGDTTVEVLVCQEHADYLKRNLRNTNWTLVDL